MRDLVDAAVLEELAEDVGRDAADRMIELFLESLPQRVRRLRAAVQCGDPEETRVAALSLHCSAQMLGARSLAEAAAGYLPGRSIPAWDPELVELARQVCADLRRER